jgi:hypothetical protein
MERSIGRQLLGVSTFDTSEGMGDRRSFFTDGSNERSRGGILS